MKYQPIIKQINNFSYLFELFFSLKLIVHMNSMNTNLKYMILFNLL